MLSVRVAHSRALWAALVTPEGLVISGWTGLQIVIVMLHREYGAADYWKM